MKTAPPPAVEAQLATLLSQPGQAVKARLLQRAQASSLRHQAYLTLRREQYRWQPTAPGIRQQPLRQDDAVSVSLLQLDAGAVLALPDGAQAAELLVVQGELHAPGLHAGDRVGPQAYLTWCASAAPSRWRAAETTLAYVRVLRDEQALPPLEARWWQMAVQQAGAPRQRRWLPSRAGVRVMPLCGDAEVVSMLVHFEPGGTVPDHHHALDEDCLVLDGDMFMGDILLRPLDYQLAPAGGGHFGEMSEGGVTFFFHGAVDPVLRA